MTPNLLVHEKSPYLRQHAYNPVNWHPWSTEVFRKALKENRPLLVSIGYATCHWCHVMEKESFADEETAGWINSTFIPVKVDREERPDIDALYMATCQLYTGSGGWPLTVLITPDQKPFFAATYLPKISKFGRIGIIELCQNVNALWENDPVKIHDIANTSYDQLKILFSHAGDRKVEKSILTDAYKKIEKIFDDENGGFGGAPYFPTTHRIDFLVEMGRIDGHPRANEMAEKVLKAMRLGGIWDHVGFGFHRYSTDNQWRLPHFEKMLYDQATMATTYLLAYQKTLKETYAWTAKEIFSYVERQLTDKDGGFYAGEDADSEGEEGKFYLWSEEEFLNVLKENDPNQWQKIFHIEEDGNFLDEVKRQKSGVNILYLSEEIGEIHPSYSISPYDFKKKWDDARKELFSKREQRPHPFKDTKILTDWNGLMITALSKGFIILKNERYKEIAERAARFILDRLIVRNQLFHRFKDGETGIYAHVNDYAYFVSALLSLYEGTKNEEYLERAQFLKDQMIENCWDDERSLFFINSVKNDPLIVRPKEFYDGAIPSANSVALHNFLDLHRLTGDSKYFNYAHKLASAAGSTISNMPEHFTHLLLGLKKMWGSSVS